MQIRERFAKDGVGERKIARLKEPGYLGMGNRDVRSARYVRMPFTTSPWMSVSRKSRPWKRKVRRS